MPFAHLPCQPPQCGTCSPAPAPAAECILQTGVGLPQRHRPHPLLAAPSCLLGAPYHGRLLLALRTRLLPHGGVGFQASSSNTGTASLPFLWHRTISHQIDAGAAAAAIAFLLRVRTGGFWDSLVGGE
jgi:hypothetical protein